MHSHWAKERRKESVKLAEEKPRSLQCRALPGPANVFYFSVNCMLIFFGVWQGQRNAEQPGHLKPFLFYANNSEVLPALL